MFTLKKLYIHKGCKYIRCLNEEESYPLEHLVREDFFAPNIAVTAIVGQNGAGKSSLIDIVFRMINNLGFCLFKKVERNASDPVCFVLGIYADLYYTIDGKECVLKCRGRALALVTEEKKIRFTVRRGHKIIREEQEFLDYEDYTDLNFGQMKEVAQLFFYTISTNYSLQAYIAQDYQEEYTLSYDTEADSIIPNGDIWLNNLFHKNDGYLCPLVLNPYRNNGKVDMNNEEHLTTQRMEAILIEDDPEHPFMLEYIYDHIDYSFRPRTIQLGFRNPIGERMYLSEDEAAQKNVQTLLEENRYKYIPDEDLSDFHEVAIDSSSYAYAILKGLGCNPYEDMYPLQKAAMEYAVYKVLGIAEKYPTYSHYGEYMNTVSLFCKPTVESRTHELTLAEELGRKAKENRSHIGLKLQQTLNFIKRSKELTEEQWLRLEKPFNYHEYCAILNIPEKGMSLTERMENLPPSIFKPQVYVRKKTDVKARALNKLSSGERQMAYQLSTLVYHMLNLCSVPNDGSRVKYGNILLILDELEICFHPEYQRIFVDRIIETIKTMGLNQTFRIHLLITTHSPFVLSDIPKSNILYLEEGDNVSDEIELNTFGANVNELLCQSFFLSGGFMGEFARKQIDSLVKYLNGKGNDNAWSEERAKYFIGLVGDEVIQYQLQQLYARRFGESDRYREWIKQEAERLGI